MKTFLCSNFEPKYHILVLVLCPLLVSLKETKGDPVQPKKAPLFNKAGWVKKDTGRLLQSYKDRYIQLEKTEVAIYENEV